jgi:hypothetical protein
MISKGRVRSKIGNEFDVMAEQTSMRGLRFLWTYQVSIIL